MFDINDEKIRDKQIRFIEILLIIGGIIGGTQIKDTADSNPEISGLIYTSWGSFLIGSLVYYITVANLQPKGDLFFAYFFISIFSAAFGFAIIALLPYMNMEFPQEGLIGFGLFIFILVSLALYGGREKDNRKT